MQKQNGQKRCPEIDIWKFIFAFVIVAHHSSYLPVEADTTYFHGGSIGVEFFFVVSGFFLAQSASHVIEYKDLAKETVEFTVRKIKSFFPYMIWAFLISLVCKTISSGGGFIKLVKNGIAGLPELLLLEASGLDQKSFNDPAWYLSAMVLSVVVLYPLILRYGKFAKQVICPLLSAFLLGYLLQKYGHFRNPPLLDGLFLKGMLRGLGEMSFGVVCYEVCQYLKKISFTWFLRIALSVIEYVGLLGIIWYSNTESCWDMDGASLILIGVAVIIAGGNLSVFSDLLEKCRIVPKMGKFSLVLYLNHIYWVHIFTIVGLKTSYKEMFGLYMLGAVCSALICWFCVDFLRVLTSKWKISSLFIKDEKVAKR